MAENEGDSENKIPIYAILEKWIEQETFNQFDAHVSLLSGDGVLLQNWEYVDCDVVNYFTWQFHNIIFIPYSKEAGKEIREQYMFNCVGFDLDFEQKPLNLVIQTDENETPVISPIKQIKAGGEPKNIQCKDGQILMLKPSQNSGGCFNDSHVSKMQQRNWILVEQQEPMTPEMSTSKTISQLDFIPTEEDRAVGFNIKLFDGNFADGLTLTTFSNFYPVSDPQPPIFAIPNNPLGVPNPEFILESLPSKDKQLFYNEVKNWKDKNVLLNPFDVIVDVVTDDGTILQTWNYIECSITGYELLLDENLLLIKYHDQWNPEIVDKTKFRCMGYDFDSGA